MVGIVSHIYNDTYQIVAISTVTGALKEGSILPLRQTYCRDVFESKHTIALTEIDGTPGLQKHPLYVKMPLEAYISAPISFEKEIWGTVNFTSIAQHKGFTKENILLVENYAKHIEEMLIELNTPKTKSDG